MLLNLKKINRAIVESDDLFIVVQAELMIFCNILDQCCENNSFNDSVMQVALLDTSQRLKESIFSAHEKIKKADESILCCKLEDFKLVNY